VASAKTRWMTRPWCSGELRECQLGKAALGSGCSGVDERRTGETGMGRRPTLLKSGSVECCREKKGGLAWVRLRGSRRRRRGGPWRGGRQLGMASNGR
jgi:hypothetical protein